MGLALAVAAAAMPRDGWAASAADAVLAEVQQALDNGDATHAKSLADGALAERVTGLQRGRLLLDRGLANELLGAQQEAMVDFTEALSANALPPAERVQVLLQRGFLLDSQGQLNDAAGDYTAVIKLLPHGATSALNNRGNIYRRQNRLDDARRDYLAALAGDNPHPEYPYFGLGQVAEAQGDIEAARGYYAKAVAANSGYALAAQRLAALGGPPPDAIAETGGTVHLKPPGSRPAPVDAPILLKPARGSAVTVSEGDSDAPPDTVHLHMPRKSRLAGNSIPRNSPVLRPAVDDKSAEAGRGSRRTAEAAPEGPLVQIGAWRSQQEAQAGWEKAVHKADGALDGLEHVIVTVDLPEMGRYYRLRVATKGPAALCAALTARSVDCLPVRN